MLFVLYCVFLQLLCVSERVFNKVLRLICVDPLYRYSNVRNMFLSGVFSFVVGLLSLPLQVIGAVLGFVFRNILVTIWVLMLVSLMVNISESSSAVLGLSVNAYNSSVGGAIDMLIVKPLLFCDIIYRALVPLYNAVMLIFSQIFMKVVIPLFGVHVDRLPRLFGDFGLSCATLGRACAVLAMRYVECGTQAVGFHRTCVNVLANVTNATVAVVAEFVPFTAPNLQCVANTNYLTLDLMTTGLYWRKTMLHVYYLLTSSCSVLTAPLDMVLYPFLDYNM